MTEQQIIEWAREAGLHGFKSPTPEVIAAAKLFIELATAHAKAEERERCEDVCDLVAYDDEFGHMWAGAEECKRSIRALED